MVPHFSKEELLSPDGLVLYQRGVNPLDMDSVWSLVKLRERLATPVMVNHSSLTLRGWRSPEENESIYASKNLPPYNRMSPHISGKAFDISVPSMTIGDLLGVVRSSGDWTGIGIYSWGLHIDQWGNKARTWNG